MLKWCEGCIWAQECGSKTFCPWGAGTCVKVKGSFENPNDFKLDCKMLSAEYGGKDEKERKRK